MADVKSMTGRLILKLRRHFRQKRYEVIHHLMQVEQASGLILDLGGGPASFFTAMFPKPEQVILLDINYDVVRRAKQAHPGLQAMVADAGRLPLADHAIQVTVCNSVIEHVDEPESMAREMRRVSQDYFLQTPNGNFPLETHSLVAIPFYNFIPGQGLRQMACRIFGANFAYVNSVRYVSERRLKDLFPEATLVYEKALGLKKSFYVYRRLNQ